MTSPTSPTNEQLLRMKARAEFWAQRLQSKCLQPWHEAMLELGAQTSFAGDPHNTAIELGAMQSALASLMANMLRGFAMTVSQGHPAWTEKYEAITLAEMHLFLDHGRAAVASGDLSGVEITNMRNGKPAPFDFRDHLNNGGRVSRPVNNACFLPRSFF